MIVSPCISAWSAVIAIRFLLFFLLLYIFFPFILLFIGSAPYCTFIGAKDCYNDSFGIGKRWKLAWPFPSSSPSSSSSSSTTTTTTSRGRGSVVHANGWQTARPRHRHPRRRRLVDAMQQQKPRPTPKSIPVTWDVVSLFEMVAPKLPTLERRSITLPSALCVSLCVRVCACV